MDWMIFLRVSCCCLDGLEESSRVYARRERRERREEGKEIK